MRYAIIVAYDRNRTIGVDNRLPWHLPEDMKHFRRVTKGKPIVMGRKTFESIGHPLPDRANIVVSRDPKFDPGSPDVRVCSSVAEALDYAKEVAYQLNVEEVMVIGGAQVFEETLQHAEHLYITKIDAEYPGDSRFPEFNESDWEVVGVRIAPPTEDGQPGLRFIEMRKRGRDESSFVRAA